MLKILVRKLQNVLGIYGRDGNFFPPRAALLHPDAAVAYDAVWADLGVPLRVSDVFRTPEQSMLARAAKAGVQPPGFSGHNFALCVDIDVNDCLKRTKLTKPGLDAIMERHGWYCHRQDGKVAFESWHYNYLGPVPECDKFLAACGGSTNTGAAIEAKIQHLYSGGLRLDAREVQECLTKLLLYRGEIDGVIGPRSKQAVMAFQRTWKLKATGELDEVTQRTLAVVSAELVEA